MYVHSSPGLTLCFAEPGNFSPGKSRNRWKKILSLLCFKCLCFFSWTELWKDLRGRKLPVKVSTWDPEKMFLKCSWNYKLRLPLNFCIFIDRFIGCLFVFSVRIDRLFSFHVCLTIQSFGFHCPTCSQLFCFVLFFYYYYFITFAAFNFCSYLLDIYK